MYEGGDVGALQPQVHPGQAASPQDWEVMATELERSLAAERSRVTTLMLEKERLQFEVEQQRVNYDHELNQLREEVAKRMAPPLVNPEEERKRVEGAIHEIRVLKAQLKEELEGLREQTRCCESQLHLRATEHQVLLQKQNTLGSELMESTLRVETANRAAEAARTEKLLQEEARRVADAKAIEQEILQLTEESDRLMAELRQENAAKDDALSSLTEYRLLSESRNRDFEKNVIARNGDWASAQKRVMGEYEKHLTAFKDHETANQHPNPNLTAITRAFPSPGNPGGSPAPSIFPTPPKHLFSHDDQRRPQTPQGNTSFFHQSPGK